MSETPAGGTGGVYPGGRGAGAEAVWVRRLAHFAGLGSFMRRVRPKRSRRSYGAGKWGRNRVRVFCGFRRMPNADSEACRTPWADGTVLDDLM